jgi:hypothetical protein
MHCISCEAASELFCIICISAVPLLQYGLDSPDAAVKNFLLVYRYEVFHRIAICTPLPEGRAGTAWEAPKVISDFVAAHKM